ncbi:MAG: T9SS type A sorting domain-containing protein [Ignavibacteriae bacterium]|nr:T9SS type A sorting domain-containing protein [Ignavibacteriota bacterium]
MSGTMQEGESFIFKAASFPSEYISAQFLYNIFVGAEFGIPTGSLTENIDIVINMGKFWCNLGILEKPEGLMRLFSLFVEIAGETSGYNPNGYYWFEQNKEAFLKLNMDKISYFLTLLNINDPNKIEVFYVNENSIDKEAIRKEIVNNQFIIYPQHFSLLSAGIIDGTTDVSKIDNSVPAKFELKQNYPNPFNPTTKISFSLSENNYTQLRIYNILGKEVASLINDYKKAGNYEVNFNASKLVSGIYFYTISSGNFVKTNKMILLK